MSFRFRLLGFLPVCFFLSHLRYHYLFNTPQNLLWICNVSNLTLAAGFFLNQPILIRIAFLWSIPGLPLWAIDMLNTGDYPASTFLSHVGGFIVGLIGVLKVRADKTSWFLAWIYAMAIQELSRLFTPPQLNVNVAFHPYYGWEHTFNHYWQWWAFTAVVSAFALALMGRLLYKLLPVQQTVRLIFVVVLLLSVNIFASSEQEPLSFWIADGDHSTENKLIKYDSRTGTSYVGPLKTTWGRTYGWPGDFARVHDAVYGIDIQRHRLYKLDGNTGTCTPLKSRLPYAQILSLAYDEKDDRLYGIDQASRKVLLFHLPAGSASEILTLPASQRDIRGAAYNSADHHLYYSDEATRTLYKLDLATGKSEVVMTLNRSSDESVEELDFYGARLFGSLVSIDKIRQISTMQLLEFHLNNHVTRRLGPILSDVSAHALLILSIPDH